MKITHAIKTNLSAALILLLLVGMSVSCKKSTVTEEDNRPPVEGVYVKNIAVDFSEKDSADVTFRLSDLKGKVILLVFSSMWCGPCRAETPKLMEIYNTYKERGLEVIQVLSEDEDGNPVDLSDLARWIKDLGAGFTVLGDPDDSTFDTYNVSGIPLNIVINREFIISYRISGFDEALIVQRIEEAL